MSAESASALPESAQRVAQLLQSLGHPHAVFRLSPQQLAAMTGTPVAEIALRVGAE